MKSHSKTINELPKIARTMIAPVAQCHYSHEKDGWLMCVQGNIGSQMNQVFINHEIKGYKVIGSADTVIQVMHRVGVYEINFNLPA